MFMITGAIMNLFLKLITKTCIFIYHGFPPLLFSVCVCMNGGTCTKNGKCKCKPGFIGEKCEMSKLIIILSTTISSYQHTFLFITNTMHIMRTTGNELSCNTYGFGRVKY